MHTTSEVIVLTYEQLAAMLKACKQAAIDPGAGDPPAGYEELSAAGATVADACWHKGMDDLENSVLNWAFDELKAQRDGSVAADQRATFAAMEDEQRAEYEDYVRRCGGVPISKIKP